MDGNQSGNEKITIKGRSIDVHFGISDLLKECHYICNVLPKTRETDNILGGGKLQLCGGRLYFFTYIIDTLYFYLKVISGIYTIT